MAPANKIQTDGKKKVRDVDSQVDPLPTSPTGSRAETYTYCQLVGIPKPIKRKNSFGPDISFDKLRRREMVRATWEVRWGVVNEVEVGDWAIVKWVTSSDPIYSVAEILELAHDYLAIREDDFICDDYEDLLMQILCTMVSSYPVGHRIRDTLEQCSVLDRWASIENSSYTLEWDATVGLGEVNNAEVDSDTPGESSGAHNEPESTDPVDTPCNCTMYEGKNGTEASVAEGEDQSQDTLDVKSVVSSKDTGDTGLVLPTTEEEMKADSGRVVELDLMAQTSAPIMRKQAKALNCLVYNREWHDLVQSHRECAHSGTWLRYGTCTKKESEKGITERD